MSIIETNAKECLIPLMTGGSFTVTDDHKLKLSRWATLKTMVYEYQTEDFPLVSSTEDREKFRKDITPGDRWGVWIGRCQAPEWRARTMMQAYRLRPVDVEVPKIRNVETFTIALNELLIHIQLNKQSAVPLPHVPGGLLQVWPVSSAITWPPPWILDGTEAEVIGTSIGRWLGAWPPST